MLGETLPAVATVQRHPSHPGGPRRHLYLSLTTQKSAEDVGGWQHKHLLGLGLAMTYDTQEQSYHVYTEETVDQLLTTLRQADLIIGFNTRDFDYQVLQPYTDTTLPTLPTCAMLDDVQHVLGYRLNFRHLVLETLGIERPDDSIDTLQWYRQGDIERLLHVCRRDIDLLRDLVCHGYRTGSLEYRDRSGTRKTLPVSWQFAEDYA
jgi:DEAD/DEAH box helicase domain-containing protein